MTPCCFPMSLKFPRVPDFPSSSFVKSCNLKENLVNLWRCWVFITNLRRVSLTLLLFRRSVKCFCEFKDLWRRSLDSASSFTLQRTLREDFACLTSILSSRWHYISLILPSTIWLHDDLRHLWVFPVFPQLEERNLRWFKRSTETGRSSTFSCD